MKKLIILISIVAAVQVKAQTSATDILLKAKMDSAYGYMNGAAANRQPSKALVLFTQCANAGNAAAMNAIGVLYQSGLGVAENQQTAINWFTKAANAGYTKAWYNLGTAYRDTMDFVGAYQSYCKAAALGDPQSVYSLGYLLYKGLGCTQDYTRAANLFAQGAYSGKPNSMYFYGLCLRNGYGVAINTDSARYWLTLSSSLGYQYATDELNTTLPENVTLAGTLTDKIKAAQDAMPKASNVANQYQKVLQQVAVSDVAGTYQGYLLKYDWSGKNVIEANKLNVTLNYINDTLQGVWLEDDTITLPIKALLTPNAMVFNQMQYSKINHYSPTKPELTVFQRAHLQLTHYDTIVYLSGNIDEFTPRTKEPERPIYLALVRTKASTAKGNIALVNDDGSLISATPLRVYPNPFGGTITVEFELDDACQVTTQLLTLDGKVVYSNPAGMLPSGSYTLPLNVRQVAHGYYTLVLHYGNKTRTAKVIKL